MKNKCPNCGAPINLDENVCSYCGSRILKEVAQNEKAKEQKGPEVDDIMDERDGCFKMMLTLGIISMFFNHHHGPRPPRFPRR